MKDLKIKKVSGDFPYDLLLLADETVESINKYLFNSDVYVAERSDTGEAVGVFCLYADDADTVELKNIAVAETYRSAGVGSFMISRAAVFAKESKFKMLTVGTADCGKRQIKFYERNGFEKYAVRENFFIDNFDYPIYEDGVQLKNMVMLKLELS